MPASGCWLGQDRGPLFFLCLLVQDQWHAHAALLLDDILLQETFADIISFAWLVANSWFHLQEKFIERHEVKLGFMSAFVKAAADALHLVPAVNAVIDNDEIVYRDYTDVSIAVATPKGLVVPVLRSVDTMSFAEVEKVRKHPESFSCHCQDESNWLAKFNLSLSCTYEEQSRLNHMQYMDFDGLNLWSTNAKMFQFLSVVQCNWLVWWLIDCHFKFLNKIGWHCQSRVWIVMMRGMVVVLDIKLHFLLQSINALGKKARDGTIGIDDMAGGTFTISNGGVYGSLLSTPIINPPQSAILGMHSINQRPMVIGKEILARPVMNVALTYDHRLIDGREAVTFLKRVKDVVEDPVRLLLDC